MSSLKALLFDVDGTLADTEQEGHRVAFNRAFAEADLGWHWDVSTYGQLLTITGGKERIRHFIDTFNPAMDARMNMSDFIPDLHQSKTRHYLDLLQSGSIPLRPGVKRLLTEARVSGLRLAIATTTTAENVTTLLSANLGELSVGWFDVIAAGDMVPEKKPAPDIYIYTLEKLGLNASDCLAFEDSNNGLLSATEAGLKTLVTFNTYTRKQDFGAAVAVMDQLGEPGAAFCMSACLDSAVLADATYVDVALIRRLFANH